MAYRKQRVGEYHICRRGNSWQIYRVVSVERDCVCSTPTGKGFNDIVEALTFVYTKNGWRIPENGFSTK